MAATIGDIYEVNVNYAGPGGLAQNNFGFECVTNVAGDAQANLGAAFQTALVKSASGGLMYAMANSWQSTNLHVQDVKPGTLATYIRSYTAVVGRLAAESLPPQCCSVLSLRTALKGRSYRGRIYLPGLPETYDTAGALTATAVTDIGTIITNLLGVFGPAGTNGDWRLGVISRYLNKVKRAVPVITQVTSASLDAYVMSQRRRVAGVGR